MTHKDTQNNTQTQKHKLLHTMFTYSKTHNNTQCYSIVHSDTKWHTTPEANLKTRDNICTLTIKHIQIQEERQINETQNQKKKKLIKN